MNTLADLLSFVVTALQRSGRCGAVRVLDTQSFSAHQYAIKVRAQMLNGDVLQIRIYHNDGHVDYSYQLLRGGEPVMRWDNKEHFPAIASYPHHFHSPTGEVRISPLIGDVTVICLLCSPCLTHLARLESSALRHPLCYPRPHLPNPASNSTAKSTASRIAAATASALTALSTSAGV